MSYAKKKTLKLPDPSARWLDLKAAAAYLACSVQTLRRLIRSGELQAIPGFRHHTVDKTDLDTLMIRRKKVLPPYRTGNRPDVAARHARNRKAA